MQRAALEKLSVLPQPRFDRIMTREIVQRERGFDKLQESLAFLFNHLLLHARQERRGDDLVFLESYREDGARADPAQAGHATGQVFHRHFGL